MSPRTLKRTAAAAMRAALPLAGVLTLTGCWTAPTVLAPPAGNPSLAGSMVVVETVKYRATVQSVDASQRKLILKLPDDTTTTCKLGPQIANIDRIKQGDAVKAFVSDQYAVFLVKNGPLPSAGQGVLAEWPAKADEVPVYVAPAGAATNAMPAGVVLITQDFSARVISADRSYRLLKLEYADGKTKIFKVPLPFTLENVQKGDDLIVRTTEAMAIRLEK